MNNYFNTTNEPEVLVKEYTRVNENQNRLILKVVTDSTNPVSCYDIEDKLLRDGKPMLITSIRRSLTCLAQRYGRNSIEAVGKVMGKHGRMVLTYKAI